MNSQEITELAIKRHDIDASHFQDVYSKDKERLSRHQGAFLSGRKLVLDELTILLNTLPKGSKILDVGCGTGHLTNWIKERGFDVYGIEPSTKMLGYAKLNFPEIEIKQGISSQISYPDNYFDLIVAFEVLRYLDKEENRKSFKEFHRILKKDGRFFITQVNRFSTDFYFIFHNVKSIICKITNSIHHHCNFTTPAEQVREVKNAGFRNIYTVGRFMGSTRIFYKFGSSLGSAYNALMKKIFKDQRFLKSFYKNFTGHLIVIAKK
jgi:ubiquinone/menaquinone biosynthesis C-methylase UbiE